MKVNDMGTIHIVQRGENLSKIARRYGLPNWQAIYYQSPENDGFRNARKNPNLIYPGDRIYIPTQGGVSASTGQQPTSPSASNDQAAVQAAERARIARRIVDPHYIRRVLQNSLESNRLNRRLDEMLRPRRSTRSRLTAPPDRPFQVSPTRQGSVSNVLQAIMAVPAVQNALNTLKNRVVSRVERDWDRLSTGGSVAILTQTAIISGGAIAGLLGSESRRREIYNQLLDREIPIPIPGVEGLQLRLQGGRENRAVFTYDLTQLLSQ